VGATQYRFLVVRASCPRERDAHTTVHHFLFIKAAAGKIVTQAGKILEFRKIFAFG